MFKEKRANPKTLAAADERMRCLESGEYRPCVVVYEPHPGFGVKSLATINVAGLSPAQIQEKIDELPKQM